MSEVVIEPRFAGPPRMGHGGYVVGLFADAVGVPTQVTIRRPVPLSRALVLSEAGEGRRLLTDGAEVLAEAEPRSFELAVPAPPSLEQVVAAEPRSPSFYEGRGVHPICFGCGARRDAEDGLRIFAGPCSVAGVEQVAGRFTPTADMIDAGRLAPLYAVASLDCAGAFAFIARGERAGLLGRMCFALEREVPADRSLFVTGWAVSTEGRKMFAGTALFDADGTRYARALATWFGRPRPSA